MLLGVLCNPTALFRSICRQPQISPFILYFELKLNIVYLVTQSCLTYCDCLDCSLPCSSVHGISQAGIPEQVAISSSRGSSWPRKWTHVSHISCVSCSAGRFFSCCAIGEAKHPILFYAFFTQNAPVLATGNYSCLCLHPLTNSQHCGTIVSFFLTFWHKKKSFGFIFTIPFF